MPKPERIVTELSETLSLCECKSGGDAGFWLWDETRKMNLAMRAKTPTDAFVEALEYYQDRLTEIEGLYGSLKKKVDAFVSQFDDGEEND